jgi:hypothetical protein
MYTAMYLCMYVPPVPYWYRSIHGLVAKYKDLECNNWFGRGGVRL